MKSKKKRSFRKSPQPVRNRDVSFNRSRLSTFSKRSPKHKRNDRISLNLTEPTISYEPSVIVFQKFPSTLTSFKTNPSYYPHQTDIFQSNESFINNIRRRRLYLSGSEVPSTNHQIYSNVSHSRVFNSGEVEEEVKRKPKRKVVVDVPVLDSKRGKRSYLKRKRVMRVPKVKKVRKRISKLRVKPENNNVRRRSVNKKKDYEVVEKKSNVNVKRKSINRKKKDYKVIEKKSNVKVKGKSVNRKKKDYEVIGKKSKITKKKTRITKKKKKNIKNLSYIKEEDNDDLLDLERILGKVETDYYTEKNKNKNKEIMRQSIHDADLTLSSTFDIKNDKSDDIGSYIDTEFFEKMLKNDRKKEDLNKTKTVNTSLEELEELERILNVNHSALVKKGIISE